jgi:hypothetical protein
MVVSAVVVYVCLPAVHVVALAEQASSVMVSWEKAVTHVD